MGVRLLHIPVSPYSRMAEIFKPLCCADSVLSKVPIPPPSPLICRINWDYISSDRGGPGQNLR